MFLLRSCQTLQPVLWSMQSGSRGLFITTVLSLGLIFVSSRNWSIGRIWYESELEDVSSTCPAIRLSIRMFRNLLVFFDVGTSVRDSVEFAVRLTAIFLSLFNISTIVVLNQQDIGIGPTLQSSKGSLGNHYPNRRKNEASPLLSWIVIFSAFGTFSAALWAGAMTPTASTMLVQQVIRVPSFDNTSLIREYPVESSPGPSVTTRDGLFSYSVGTKLLNSLIASGLSATTLDSKGSFQGKRKLDNTRFFYEGRSYGVGSSVGIGNTAVKEMSSARMYRFQEIGYSSQVECHYNKIMDFRIDREYPHRTYAVTGFLPDTVGSAQWSEYIGSGPDSIVAIGVAHSPKSPRRYISIAAGENYRALNTTECTIDFSPTLFQVTVEGKERRIVVSPLKGLGVNDFDPQRALARTAMRQFDLMSNSLTSFHTSVLGDAIFSSIATWNITHNAEGTIPEASATLAGLQNSLTAMLDSMLEAYGAAQLIVGNFTQPVAADVAIDVFKLGNRAMIFIVSILNGMITALFWFKVASKRSNNATKCL